MKTLNELGELLLNNYWNEIALFLLFQVVFFFVIFVKEIRKENRKSPTSIYDFSNQLEEY